MTIKKIRKQLIENIEIANSEEIKNIYKLYQVVQQQKQDDIAMKKLSKDEKNKIKTGLAQLKEGKGKPIHQVTSRLNKKYGVA